MKMEVESGSRMEKVSDNSASSVSALSEGKVTFISQTHSFLLQHHFDLINLRLNKTLQELLRK